MIITFFMQIENAAAGRKGEGRRRRRRRDNSASNCDRQVFEKK